MFNIFLKLKNLVSRRSLAGKSSNGDNSSSWGGEVTSNISIKNADGKVLKENNYYKLFSHGQ